MWPTVQWKVYAFKHENNANKDERIKILDFFFARKSQENTPLKFRFKP